jgi:hypothetical protein
MRIKIDPLDRLFSQYIRLRAKECCERCGAFKGIQRLETSHFFSRRKKSVRFNPDNAAALCFTCHLYFTENPLAHVEWFKERLGDEKFTLLNIQANVIGSKPDINAITLYLKGEIDKLRNFNN